VLPALNLISHYSGLNFSQTGGWIPPDSCGAAGPTSYVETTKQEIALYTPKATGARFVTDSFSDGLGGSDFWYTRGQLPPTSPNSGLFNPTMVWDDQIQRFLVGEQDADFGIRLQNFDLAVSKTATPATLTAADWNFYQISTTESGFDAEGFGNMGYNHDAFVFTLRMFVKPGQPPDHILVTSVRISDLVAGNPLTVFHNDVSTQQPLRAAVMHDSRAGDPMWLVGEHSPTTDAGHSIDVYKMTNVLSNSATITLTTLAVNPYTDISKVPPLQPDGTVVTPFIDSGIAKAAESNNTLVATQAVSVSPTEDDARWYSIDVSSGTPVLRDQGNVGAGNDTYTYFPGIDINPSGDIGMSFMQSGTGSGPRGQFMSVYATGRTQTDPSGTMEMPIRVQAGAQNYHDFGPTLGGPQRAGDFSGISVDTDGSFWIVNEFADSEPVGKFSADWGTAIGNFTVSHGQVLPTDLALSVSGPASGVEGGPLVYNVTITNKGPADGVNVLLSDPLPAGTSFVSASFTQGTFGAVNGVFSLSIPAVANQGTVTGTITLSPLEEDAITNTLTLTADNPDTDPTNDQGSVTTTISDTAVVPTAFAVRALEGQSGDIVVATFTDPGGPELVADYSAAIDWGDSQSSSGTITFDPSTGIFSVHGSHSYAEEGAKSITVTVHHDTASDASVTNTAQIDDAAVIPTGGLVIAVTEGSDSGAQTVATFTDPGGAEALADYTANINWGDAQTSAGTISFASGVFTVTGSHRYSEESAGYTIAVTIGHDTAANVTVTSTAVASDPAVVASGGFVVTATEGSNTGTATVATFSDPSGAEALSEYSAAITWEPGQTSTGTISFSGGVFTVTGNHVYQSEGTIAFTVAIHHGLATDVLVTGSAKVSDATLVGNGGLTANFVEGSASTNLTAATFTDPGGTESLSDYSASIDWGSGATSTGTISFGNGVFTVSGSHNYTEEGASDFTVAIHHDHAPDVTLTGHALVADAPLTVTASAFQPTEGSAFSGPVAMFLDANPNGTIDEFGATIQWGDGSTSSGTLTPHSSGGFDVSGSHTYAQVGNKQISVSVHDAGGATASVISNVKVADAALTASSAGTIRPVEGAGFSVLVATFSDANPESSATDFTASIDWGDGTSSSGTVSSGPNSGFDVMGSHTYTQEGARQVVVAVLDRGGSSASATSAVIVTDAALTATGVTLHTIEGGVDGGIHGVVATFHDADPFAAAGEFGAGIDWGDGNSSHGTLTGSGGDFQVSANHNYDHLGSFSVSIMILDPGGSTAQAKTTATVGEAPFQGIPIIFSSSSLFYNAVVARFADAGNDPPQTYAVTIDWGDGTAPTAGFVGTANNPVGPGTPVFGSHAFAAPGDLTVTVTVSEPGNTPITITSRALIGTANQRWLARAYQDLLQRQIDASGLASWGSLLDQGVSRTQVVFGIQSSPEYRTKLVQSWYVSFLGRQADPLGLAGYVQLLGSMTGIGGDNLENFVKLQLISSQEYFFNRGGGSNQGFLQALSHDLLGHNFDPTTAATLSLMLAQGASRFQIAALVMNGLQAQQVLLANDYVRLLHRVIDPTGLQSGLAALQQGLDDNFIIANLIGSEEYFAQG
jgi:uncharacterized repeat protein (TIGR01451 family)